MFAISYTTVNGVILSENRNGVLRDYMPDSLGSTYALLDNTQTMTDTFTYWPYGEVRTHTGTTPTPFMFCGTLGYFFDALSAMCYVRARYLITALARWLTVDPLWPNEEAYAYYSNTLARRTTQDGVEKLFDGENLYAYAYGSPATYTDPSGHTPSDCVIQSDPITKARCRQFCDGLKKSSDRSICYAMCKLFHGISCIALDAFCAHLCRHGQKQMCEICELFSDEVCPGE